MRRRSRQTLRTALEPRGRTLRASFRVVFGLMLGFVLTGVLGGANGAWSTSATAVAQEARTRGALGPVAPLLDAQTIAVVRIDVPKLKPAAIGQFVAPLAETAGLPAEKTKQTLAIGEQFQNAWTAAGGGDLIVALDLNDAPKSPAIVFGVAREGGRAAALAELFASLPFEARETIGDVVVAGSKGAVERAKKNRAAPHADLQAALAAVADSPIQVAVQLPSDVRRVAMEFAPKLPAEWGVGTSEELASSFRWLAVGVDSPPTFGLKAVLQADGAPGAQRWHKATLAGLAWAVNQSPVRQLLPNADAVAARLKPEVREARVELKLEGEDAARWLRDSLNGPLAAARRSAARTNAMNNLRQIALAMHNYHDVYRKFPPAASRGKDGRPLLSWRVHVLPFLEQGPLYEKFKLDEPWDSAHNKTLIEKMPQVYAAPGHERLAATGKTVYVVPTGEKAVFSDKDGMSIAKITDGTSNTLMTIQVPASRAVIWTQPADWEYDVKNVLDRLVEDGEQGFLAGLCDGSVRFISRTIDPKTLLKLLQANDGQVIDPF